MGWVIDRHSAARAATIEFRIRVTAHDDGTWAYEEDTVLKIRGQAGPFHHTDRNRLSKIAEPTPSPLARG